MSLRRSVLDFVDAARRSPANASSPEWLGSLEQEAFDSLDGSFFALNAPVTTHTWQVRTILLGADAQSDRIPFEFPQPTEVLGFRSVVAPIPGAAGLDPGSITGLGSDVVDCQIDVDNSELLTFDRNVSAPGLPSNSNFVVLSALDIQAPRIFAAKLTAPRPVLGFTFQWSLGIATPFADSLITIAMFVRELDRTTLGMNKSQRIVSR